MSPLNINFWNGNKSASRQSFELLLLEQILSVTETTNDLKIIEDLTAYPDAKDEGQVFQNGTDVCVTVAGNPKFRDGDYIPIYEPLLNGLLGHRLIIIRQSDQAMFAQTKTPEQLRAKTIGIPATWADANLFRDNGYSVSEKGTLDDIFHRLDRGECDYVALGVNEIRAIFDQFAKSLGNLMIEPRLRLYYPFALVFYINPHKPELANTIAKGIQALKTSGEYQRIFSEHFGNILTQSKLSQRLEIQLENIALPLQLHSQMQQAHAKLLKR